MGAEDISPAAVFLASDAAALVTRAELKRRAATALQPGSHLIYRGGEIKRGGKRLPPVMGGEKAI
jgi:hypothetical protein